LILHAVLLLNLEVIELLLLFVLLLDYLGLLSLFPSGLEDGFLNFSLFILTLLVDRVIVLGNHPLVFISVLIVIDFLKTNSDK